MNLPSSRCLVLALVAAPALLAIPTAANAQKAKPAKAACGAKFLPFIQGTEWVYEGVAAPAASVDAGAAARLRLAPKQPAKISVKVVSVETTSGTTTIGLEETVDDKSRATTVTCDKDGMTISPQSFFFLGEPGGGLATDLENVERTGPSFALKRGKLGGPSFTETIKAKVISTPTKDTGVKLPSGSIEMERMVIVGGLEIVNTNAGKFTASRVIAELIGRVRVEPATDKPLEIPANTVTSFWFADDVGLVQAQNSYGHRYQLVERKQP